MVAINILKREEKKKPRKLKLMLIVYQFYSALLLSTFSLHIPSLVPPQTFLPGLVLPLVSMWSPDKGFYLSLLRPDCVTVVTHFCCPGSCPFGPLRFLLLPSLSQFTLHLSSKEILAVPRSFMTRLKTDCGHHSKTLHIHRRI